MIPAFALQLYTHLFNSLYIPIVFLNLILLISLIAINIRTISSYFRRLNKTYTVLLIICLALGLYLRLSMFSNSDDVNSSSWEYLHTANCLSKDYKCPGQVSSHIPISHPIGYPMAMRIFLIFSPISVEKMHAFNILCDMAAIAVLFLLVFLLINNAPIAIFSVFLYAIIPEFVLYANKGEAEAFSNLVTLLAIFFIVSSLRQNTFKAYLLAWVSVFYAMEVRTETIGLLATLFCLGFFLLRPARTNVNLALKKWAVSFLLTVILSLPFLHFVGVADFHDKGGLGFGIQYIPKHVAHWLERYIQVFYTMPSINVMPLLFFVCSAFFFVRYHEQRKPLIFVAAWMIMHNTLYLSFFRGPGGHFVLTFAPFLILIAAGTYFVSNSLLRVFSMKYLKNKMFLVTLLNITALLIIFYHPNQITHRSYTPTSYETITILMRQSYGELNMSSYILVPWQTILAMQYDVGRQDFFLGYTYQPNNSKELVIINNSSLRIPARAIQKMIDDGRLYFISFWNCSAPHPDRRIETTVLTSHPDCDIISKTFRTNLVTRKGEVEVWRITGYRQHNQTDAFQDSLR
ncbi:MAG: glycosyltransferase family 39 protein [Candidatus Woesearchaeota archaeon]